MDRKESNSSVPNKDHKHGEHEITIKVNGTKKTVTEKELSFYELVALAFPGIPEQDAVATTVSYLDKHGNVSGSLVAGDSVKVKEGMQFNVSRTNQS